MEKDINKKRTFFGNNFPKEQNNSHSRLKRVLWIQCMKLKKN